MTEQPPEETGVDLDAYRARQRSRNRALGLVLLGLVVLFFAITIVKMKLKGSL